MRYLSSTEAIYRIFEKPMSVCSHNIEDLPIHVEGKQRITIKPTDQAHQMESKVTKNSKLMAFFALNNLPEHQGKYLYSEIPTHFVWHAG
jgi:hypothetical protein